MSLKTYNVTALIGGAARALDSYAIGDLADGYRALFADGTNKQYFLFVAASTTAENVATSPMAVRPDDYSTAGVWIEQIDIFGTGAGNACVGNDSRLSDARTPTAHDLDSHNSCTLAELSTDISDNTLIGTDDSRLSDSRTCDNSFDTAATALANLGVTATATELNTVADGSTAKNSHTHAASGLESGTEMWFYQNVAPTDWTINSTPADAVLAVKGGSNAYNVNGGNQAGTWTQPDHTHTDDLAAPAHTHIPGSFVVNTSHSHGLGGIGGTFRNDASFKTDTQGGSTSVTGTSGAASVTALTGSVGNGATAATYRTLAQVGIICEKD